MNPIVNLPNLDSASRAELQRKFLEMSVRQQVEDASHIVKGITRLSVAPVAEPIAVGDNDPRNTDARTPLSHASSHESGGSDEIDVSGLLGELADMQKSKVNPRTALIAFTIRGSSAGISTGSKGFWQIPFSMIVGGWTLLEISNPPVAGSAVIDVRKCGYDDYPTTTSIAGTQKPTLSSAIKNRDLSLTSWDTLIDIGDILEFRVDSSASVANLSLAIFGVKIDG